MVELMVKILNCNIFKVTLRDTLVPDTNRCYKHHLDHPYPICENPDNGWADDTTKIIQRFADAKKAVAKGIEHFKASEAGKYSDFSVIVHEHVEYYVKSLYNNVYNIAPNDAIRYKSSSY